MPKETTPTPEINLLPEDELSSRPGGKFLQWALSWGKRIVVGTELVVLSAFFSRFWLDATVADLAEKVDQKRAVVVASAETEKKFLAVKRRLARAGELEKRESLLALYQLALSQIPAGVTVEQISLNRQVVGFSGSSDEVSLANLTEAFRARPDFGEVAVERVAKKGSSLQVDFALKATYIPKAKKTL